MVIWRALGNLVGEKIQIEFQISSPAFIREDLQFLNGGPAPDRSLIGLPTAPNLLRADRIGRSGDRADPIRKSNGSIVSKIDSTVRLDGPSSSTGFGLSHAGPHKLCHAFEPEHVVLLISVTRNRSAASSQPQPTTKWDFYNMTDTSTKAEGRCSKTILCLDARRGSLLSSIHRDSFCEGEEPPSQHKKKPAHRKCIFRASRQTRRGPFLGRTPHNPTQCTEEDPN